MRRAGKLFTHREKGEQGRARQRRGKVASWSAGWVSRRNREWWDGWNGSCGGEREWNGRGNGTEREEGPRNVEKISASVVN